MRATVAPLALAVSIAEVVAAAPAVEGHRFVGRWEYVGGNAERDRLRFSIEGLVGRMSHRVRPVARQRLQENSPLPEQVVIVATPLGLRVRVAASLELDGLVRLERGEWLQRRRSVEGLRVVRYALSADGMRLTLRITTRSGRLPAPLDYEVTLLAAGQGSMPCSSSRAAHSS